MPMSPSFKERLFPALKDIAGHFGTPFHIYDETGIRETGEALVKAFSGLDSFREYFAVKALPNPHILAIMREMGFGFDCSSIPELLLSRQVGALGAHAQHPKNRRPEPHSPGNHSRPATRSCQPAQGLPICASLRLRSRPLPQRGAALGPRRGTQPLLRVLVSRRFTRVRSKGR